MGRKGEVLRFFMLLVLAFSFTFLACKKNVSETKPQNAQPTPKVSVTPSVSTPNPSPSIPANKDYPGKGTVTKINLEAGSVELDHEEIKDLMPRMIMEFYVKDKSMLNGLKVGDKVDFVVRYKDGTEIIVSIKKAK